MIPLGSSKELSLKEEVKDNISGGDNSGHVVVEIVEDLDILTTITSSNVHTTVNERKTNEKDTLLLSDRTTRKIMIQTFLNTLINQKVFSLNYVKRLIAKELRQRGFLDVSMIEKPDGLNVEEMFDSSMVIPGNCPLDSTAHELNTGNITQEHILGCSTCYSTANGSLHPSCYFNTMKSCLINGWSPPVDTGNISRAYGDNNNHYTVNAYD